LTDLTKFGTSGAADIGAPSCSTSPRVHCQQHYPGNTHRQDFVGQRTFVTGSGHHLPGCGTGEVQRPAHISCCGVVTMMTTGAQ
uniref:Uncharacterized protein n=1 Tax=Romanomermis culicivorax TaxID=13658 RepID=A0A915HTN4_ROMCU